MNFDRKSYGAIYVDKSENIKRVKEIIETIDEYEYEYLPEELIKPMKEFGNVAYTHKFYEIDMDIVSKICMDEGIFILCVKCESENGFDAENFILKTYIK